MAPSSKGNAQRAGRRAFPARREFLRKVNDALRLAYSLFGWLAIQLNMDPTPAASKRGTEREDTARDDRSDCHSGKITLAIDRPQLTPEDGKRLMQAQRNNKASE